MESISCNQKPPAVCERNEGTSVTSPFPSPPATTLIFISSAFRPHCTLNLKSFPLLKPRTTVIPQRDFSLYSLCRNSREKRNEKIIAESSHKSESFRGFSACIRDGTVGCRIESRAVHYWVPSSHLHLTHKKFPIS